MYLSQVDVHIMRAANSRNFSTINDWQLNLYGQLIVNTAFSGAGIDKSPDALNGGLRYLKRIRILFVIRVKPNIHKKSRPISHQ